MVKKLGLLLMIFMLFSTSAFAHVMNRNNVYEDLTLTEAADEIVLLSSLGIVSYLDGSYEYKPSEVLSAKDLAAWVASYYGLEGQTSDELAQVALAEGVISTIDGDATYALVNEAYFHSMLELENPNATMTKEEFALFVFSNIRTDLGSHTLLDIAGFTEGPTGTIEHVERVQKQTATGSSVYVYMMTIDGIEYEMGMHLRAIADTVDPAVWVGETVSESFYGPNVATDKTGVHVNHSHEEHSSEQHNSNSSHHHNDVISTTSSQVVVNTALQFLVIGKEPFTSTVITKNASTSQATEMVENEQIFNVEQNLASVADEEVEVKSSQTWIYMIVVIILVIIIGIIIKRRKK